MPVSADGWIVSTTVDKPDPATRKRIRSQVMRGKNTRTIRRHKEAEMDEGSGHPWLLTAPRKIASEMALFGFNSESLPGYQTEMLYKGTRLKILHK